MLHALREGGRLFAFPDSSVCCHGIIVVGRAATMRGARAGTLLIVNSLIVSISLARPALSLDLSYINLASSIERPLSPPLPPPSS